MSAVSVSLMTIHLSPMKHHACFHLHAHGSSTLRLAAPTFPHDRAMHPCVSRAGSGSSSHASLPGPRSLWCLLPLSEWQVHSPEPGVRSLGCGQLR